MKTKQMIRWIASMAALIGMSWAYAHSIIPIYMLDANGQGKSVGTIKVEKGYCGLILRPHLHDLPPGIHGFHIHENPSCADNGMAAGGHFDPAHTTKHDGPYSDQGHLGDLPVLIVDKNGNATLPLFVPRFTLSELHGHSMIIHAGEDNYSDTPEKLGGGGARIACGVIG